MIKIPLHIFLALLLGCLTAVADDGGTESPFAFGAGARPLSLGGACLAGCNSASASFWNPSGLSTSEKISLTGFFCRLYDSDVNYQYFGMVYPTVDYGSIGLSVFRLGIDGIEKRDAGNLLLGDFDDNRMAYYLAYANRFYGYNFGLALGIEQHSIYTYKATSSPGINLSLGRKIKIGGDRLKFLNLTLNVANMLKPSMKLDLENIKYPTVFNISAALNTVPIPVWKSRANLYLNIKKIEDLDWKLSAGLEYIILNTLALRGGLNGGNLSFGAGLSFKFIEFDYALVDRDLDLLHTFSLTASFGKSISEKRQIKMRRQEERFNRMMNEQLEKRNLDMVRNLEIRGKDLLNRGDLTEAVNYLEKAIFIARNNNLDTTTLAPVLNDARERFEKTSRNTRYMGYLDSANVRFAAADYIGAKYFANLALGEFPDSDEAAGIIDRSDQTINEMVSIDRMINRKLTQYDSLMSYGQVDEAAAIIRSLQAYAVDDERIKLALKKIDFEYAVRSAQRAFDIADYNHCIVYLDSALVLFPNHKNCLEMKNRTLREKEILSERQREKILTMTEPVSVDDNIAALAENKYSQAMQQFRNGRLAEAVAGWEEVEQLIPGFKSVRQYLVKAYKYIGVEQYGQNLLKEAIDSWSKALKYDPRNQEIIGYINRSQSEIMKLKELSYDEE
jgi:tetratricopeptide (TPR) repeat protein